MYSIGIDVSKSSVNVYIPIKDLDLEIENNTKAFISLYSKLKKYYKKEINKLVFVFESTGSYSSALYNFCAKKGIKIFFINPKQARNFAKAIAQRNKSDKIDARVLSQAIVIAKDKDIVIPKIDTTANEIKDIMVYYKLLVKQRTQLINHLESLIAKGNRLLSKSIKAQIKALKQKEEKLIDDIYEIIKSNPKLKEKYDYIISIDGIGKVGATVLLHLFIKYPNANQKQIISLAGLDPVMKESGTSVKKRNKISKAGNKIYRGTLFMPAMAAIRHNKKLKLFYERLKAKGKHTTLSQIAVMRKLIIIAHSLYKNNQFYDKERYLKESGLQVD